MKKRFLFVLLGLLTLTVVAMVGCSSPSANSTQTEPTLKSNNTTNASIPDASWFPSKFSEIDVTHVGTGPSFASFSGPSGLPDGTILLSALYEDGKLLPGWPVNQPIVVENGTWEVKVSLGAKGSPPALRSGPSYLFIVWRKDNPQSLAGEPFDLVGPPPEAP